MKHFIYPIKDTTIYSYSASMNTGIDEILEIEKTIPVGTEPIHKARAIIGFDFDTEWKQLTSSFSSFSSSWAADTWASKFRLYTTKAEKIRYSYVIEASPIKISSTGNWQMGLGRRSHTPITEEGCSWAFRTESGSDAWLQPGGDFWQYPNITTQAFEYESTDIAIEASHSIAKWQTTTDGDKKGVIFKFSSSLEEDTLEYGCIKFFSRDTNTIYSPRLELAWDDSEFSTGSLSAATSDEILVYVKNNKYEYNENEVVRFEVRARDTYVTQTYGTSSAALETFYLPTGSYYAIKDAETEEAVIDFDTSYTKISCTSSGNFFNVYMKALTPERLYKLVLKVNNRKYNGQVEHFDPNIVFRIAR
tara:strand:+ start:3519 stop:4604 length:1086 start_codon:yes stop_codon:yes gene_type:complete